MSKKRRPDVQKLIHIHGYEGAKRKLRMAGYTRAEIMELTEFLFRETRRTQ